MKEKTTRRMAIFGIPLGTLIGSVIPKIESWLSLFKMGIETPINPGEQVEQFITLFDIIGWTVTPLLATLLSVFFVKLWYKVRDLQDLLYVTHAIMDYRCRRLYALEKPLRTNDMQGYLPNTKDLNNEMKFITNHLNHAEIFGNSKTPSQIKELLSRFYNNEPS